MKGSEGLPQHLWRLRDRAPPARRIASCARSYVCFGPINPAGFARERFGAWRDIALYEPGGRARLSQALLARNKRRSEQSSRCAARAALGLTGAKLLKACTYSRVAPEKALPGGTCTWAMATFKASSKRLPTPRVDSWDSLAPSNSVNCRQIDKPIPRPP